MANITKIQLQPIEGGANWYPITNVDCVEGLKDWLDTNKYLTDSVLTDYVTSDNLESTLEDYVLTSDLNTKLGNYVLSSLFNTEIAKKADKTEIEDMATQSWVESQKYLTSHQSLDEYSTTSEVEDLIAAAITESEKKIFGEGELQQAYDTIKEIGDYLNIHDGAYKNLLASVNGKLDASDYETDKDTFATKTWVNEQEFLTEHQSLDDYYTKSDVDDAIEGLSEVYQPKGEYLTEVPDTYATKTYVDNAIKALKELIGVKATLAQ